jgi:hypothetical protein
MENKNLPLKEYLFDKIYNTLYNYDKVRILMEKAYNEVSDTTDAVVYFSIHDSQFHICFTTENENLEKNVNSSFIPAWYLSLDDLLRIPLEEIFSDEELEKIIKEFNSNLNNFIKNKNIDMKDIKERQLFVLTNSLIDNAQKIIDNLQLKIDKIYETKQYHFLNKLKFN